MKRFWEKNMSRSSSSERTSEYAEDSPEAIVLKEMTMFCESTGAAQNAQGDEFVHLPKIVEAAESSPAAAREAAYRIRKYLSTPNSTPRNVQYNAVMLIRILGDNPGHSFTRNLDSKFVAVIKDLLRHGRDWHVQHCLRQYLNTIEADRHGDQDLQLLLQMWAKEKTKENRAYAKANKAPVASGPPPPMAYVPQMPYQAQPPARTLPEPSELAARIEEARNSAKLLTQFVQTTPQAELEDNDLIKEFLDRCRSSGRLIQSFIHSNDPTPDEDTLLTLIEVNDELSVAVSQQQRAVVKARKARGAATPNSSNVNSPSPPSSEIGSSRDAVRSPPADAPRLPERQASNPIELPTTAMSGDRPKASRTNTERYEYNSADFVVQNPFADDYAANDSDAERHRQPAATNTSVGGPEHPTH